MIVAAAISVAVSTHEPCHLLLISMGYLRAPMEGPPEAALIGEPCAWTNLRLSCPFQYPFSVSNSWFVIKEQNWKPV
ncbi:hypothetical protein RSAG8_10825, partial [Rhizoctonia solani AG-8 WAC10335]